MHLARAMMDASTALRTNSEDAVAQAAAHGIQALNSALSLQDLVYVGGDNLSSASSSSSVLVRTGA